MWRTLERLGGTWWAEGEVGRGATFFFALPEAAGRPDDRRPQGPPGQ